MSDSPLRRELGRLIRQEREAANLSLADLAARAGISQNNLGRIERATLAPSLETMEKIFLALGLQLRLDVEPLDDDLGTQLERLSWLPLTERLERSGLSHLLTTLDNVAFVLDGALAANLLGVPLPVDALDLVLTWADSDRFTGWLLKRFAYRYHERSGEFRMLDLDPRAPGPHYWQTNFGKVRAHMVDELPDSVEVAVDDRTYRVRPLAEITLPDRDTARLLQRFRERMAGPPGRGLHAVAV
jgi:transcriptional regulator with XRE-family HTH domain